MTEDSTPCLRACGRTALPNGDFCSDDCEAAYIVEQQPEMDRQAELDAQAARLRADRQHQNRPVRLTSFGYLHLDASPEADLTVDVRRMLHDPAAAKDILDLDGRDERVQSVVAHTPGALELLEGLVGFVAMPAGPRRIAIGCAGGRHRAAALVELLASDLRGWGFVVGIEHLHIHLPRVLKSTQREGSA